MMQRFSELVIKFRTLIIIGVILVTLLSLYFLKGLQINNDIFLFFPQDDPSVVLFNKVSEEFKGTSLAIIALKTDDVFKYRTLRRIRDLTGMLERKEGVTNVMSLLNIIDIRRIEGGIEVGKLIEEDKIPRSSEELRRLREYTLNKEMYTNTLISSDGTVTTIICRVSEGIDQFAVGTELRKTVNYFYQQEGEDKEEVFYAGVPFQMVFINDVIIRDNKRLIPLVILLVMLTLYLNFRSVRGVILPLLTVIISAVWSLSLMSIFGVYLNMASIIIPVLLIAVGSAYGIHLINKYNEETRYAFDKIEGLSETLSKVGVPIILAAVTTMIGFISFLSSDLSFVKETGIFTALGIFFALTFTLTFIPAVLSILKVKKRGGGPQKEGVVRMMRLNSALEGIGNFVVKHKNGILIAALIIAVVALLGLPRLSREVYWEEFVKEGSEIKVAETMMRKKFGGSTPDQIYVKGDIKNPFVLKEMIKIEKFLRSLPYIHNPRSIADLIGETNNAMNARRAIPDTDEGIGNLFFFLEGNDILDLLITKKSDEALIQATVGTMDTAKMIEIVHKINAFLKDEVKTEFVEVDLNKAGSGLKQVLEEKRIEDILYRIKLDVKGRCPDCQFDEKVMRIIVTRAVKQGMPAFEEGLLGKIRERMEGYFMGGESDVVIDSDEVAARVVDEISLKLKEGEMREEDIENLLRKNLSEEIVANDPEALVYAADSLYNIIKQEREEFRVQRLMAEAEALLPTKLNSNRNFWKDLKADLWEVNEPHAAIDYQDYLKLIGSESDEKLEPQRFSVQQTGFPPILLEMYNKLVKSLLMSLFFALVMVFLVLVIQLRSLVGGLISIAPISLTVMVCFGLMGYLDIALDDMTVMTASLAIGIGIDYAIHFTSRFRAELKAGKNELEALVITLKTTGRAITINALTVIVGFIVLVGGTLLPMQRFGWLIALLMFISALGALTLLPALILTTRPRFVRNLVSSGNNTLIRPAERGT
ncbi:MAG: RND family transporter [Deltaproteobacteria bacterium]|nr:MAG: RND family transporter [Deltaproteobacteria bacterium]